MAYETSSLRSVRHPHFRRNHQAKEYCLAINFLNFFDLPGPHPGVEVGSQEWPTAEA